jgi:hypothetical protein
MGSNLEDLMLKPKTANSSQIQNASLGCIQTRKTEKQGGGGREENLSLCMHMENIQNLKGAILQMQATH